MVSQTGLAQLGLLDTATEDDVKQAWRKLCNIHHPDRGGNAVEFNTYRLAYKQALAEVAAPRPAPFAKGPAPTPRPEACTPSSCLANTAAAAAKFQDPFNYD